MKTIESFCSPFSYLKRLQSCIQESRKMKFKIKKFKNKIKSKDRVKGIACEQYQQLTVNNLISTFI